MRRWRGIVAGCLLGLAGGAAALPAGANALAAGEVRAEESPELVDILNNGLKVRTDSERQFVNRVVQAVEDGLLSEALVKALFQRSRREHSRYPLPYFVAMIRRVAAQKGVEL